MNTELSLKPLSEAIVSKSESFLVEKNVHLAGRGVKLTPFL